MNERKVDKSVVRPATLFGLETLPLRKREEGELEGAERKMLSFSLVGGEKRMQSPEGKKPKGKEEDEKLNKKTFYLPANTGKALF